MKRYLLPLGTLLAAVLALAVPAGAADVLAQASPAPSPSPSPTPPPKAFQMSGYVDAGYVSATSTNGNNIISGRVFDTVSGSPTLHSLNLQSSYTGPIGGKIELSIGDDAEYLHSYPQIQNAIGAPPYPATYPSLFAYGPGISSKVDLTQGYLSLSAGKFTLIGGKFATLAGAEVLESPSDMNFSRSILFGYAIPFTHTGVRLTFAATPQLNLIVGANRGWDTTKTLGAPGNGGGTIGDNNSFTGEFGAAWTPSSAFALTAQGYTGKVDDWAFVGCINNGCVKSVVDVVGTLHLNSSWTVVVNGDSGQQTNTITSFAPLAGGTVKWSGIAGYISDAITSKLTGTLRYELFSDPNGYRMATFVNNSKWTEGTVTAQYAATPNLTLRGEFRWDSANTPFFAKGNTAFVKTNSQFGLEAIVHAP